MPSFMLAEARRTVSSARFTALAAAISFSRICFATGTARQKHTSGSSFESHSGLKLPMASASEFCSPVLSFRSNGWMKFSSSRRA